jgi:serine/threonine protein kinase
MGCNLSRPKVEATGGPERTLAELVGNQNIEGQPSTRDTESEYDWPGFPEEEEMVGGPTYVSFSTFFNQVEDPQIFEYKFLKSIGRGGHAEVYLCEHEETGEKFAAKVYSKTLLFKNTMYHKGMANRVEQEIQVMMLLKHPNLMPLREVLDDDETDSVIFILDYAPFGSLLPHSSVSTPIPEERCRWIFAQLASAVQEIHRLNVVHRDIKPENIMMDVGDRAILSDFSAARLLEDGTDLVDDTDGTPAFYSPEQCKGQAYHAKPSDIWSMGVSLYLMVFGHLPFFEEKKEDSSFYLTQLFKISQMIQVKELRLDRDIEISEQMEDLLYKVMDKNPVTRLEINQVLAHPWVAQAGYNPECPKIPDYLKEQNLSR